MPAGRPHAFCTEASSTSTPHSSNFIGTPAMLDTASTFDAPMWTVRLQSVFFETDVSISRRFELRFLPESLKLVHGPQVKTIRGLVNETPTVW